MQAPWTPAFSWLDVKLAMRMMRKYPGVSLAIVLALAIGIPVSLLPNHLVESALGQSPPFDVRSRAVSAHLSGGGSLPQLVADEQLTERSVRYPIQF